MMFWYFLFLVFLLVFWGLWFSSLHSLGRFWSYIVRLAKLAWGLLAVCLLYFFVLKPYVHVNLVWIATGIWLLWKLGKYASQESFLWASSFGISLGNSTTREQGQPWLAPASVAWESHDDWDNDDNHGVFPAEFSMDYDYGLSTIEDSSSITTYDEPFAMDIWENSDDFGGINPASGLPLIGGIIDTEGNPYGCGRSSFDDD